VALIASAIRPLAKILSVGNRPSQIWWMVISYELNQCLEIGATLCFLVSRWQYLDLYRWLRLSSHNSGCPITCCSRYECSFLQEIPVAKETVLTDLLQQYEEQGTWEARVGTALALQSCASSLQVISAHPKRNAV